MLSWKIGDVEVTRVVETDIPGKMTWILPDATPENLLSVDWCRPHFVDAVGNAITLEHTARRGMLDADVPECASSLES